MRRESPAQAANVGALHGAVQYVRGRFVAAGQAVLHLPGPLFLSAIAVGFAFAGFLLAEGLEGVADFRDRAMERRANTQAPSPWSYRDRPPYIANGVAEGQTADIVALSVVLRVDSLTSARDEKPPCGPLAAVERALKGRGRIVVRYVALSDAVPTCAAQLPFEAFARVPRPSDSAIRSARQGSASMRWAILDGNGRSLYSRSEPPSPKQVIDVLDVFRGRPSAAACGKSDAVETEEPLERSILSTAHRSLPPPPTARPKHQLGLQLHDHCGVALPLVERELVPSRSP